MALEDPRGHRVDRVSVGDVAQLDLAAELLGERAEPVLPARDEHALPALLREESRRRLADPGRRARDDGDPPAGSRLVRCARRRHGRTP